MTRTGMLRIIALRWLLGAAVAAGAVTGSVSAGQAADSGQGLQRFRQRILPVLERHCYECHSGKANEFQGGLRLDTRAGIRRGGDSGPAVVPGDAEGSLLVRAIRHQDFEMPPGEERLGDEVIDDVVRWIESGAPDMREGPAAPAERYDWDQARRYWAFQPLGHAAPPAVDDIHWPNTWVDRFLLARLESEGLAPAPPAGRRHLVRRLYFDLLGLPPTPDEVQAFLSDTAPDAYERLVEHNVVVACDEEQARWQAVAGPLNEQIRSLREDYDKAEQAEAKQQIRDRIGQLEAQLPAPLPSIPSVRNDPEQRTAIHMLRRGSWDHKGRLVGPRPPSVLVPEQTAELPADVEYPRRELAAWVTDPHNPLTARVFANRLWQHHFGQGLVRTPNDFGSHGERPSHPELLDRLAAELVRQQWRAKPIHRLLLVSSAYRQSARSPVAGRAMQADPDNRWLWRFSRRRLSAEEIRDAMLAVSGRLHLELGGPSVLVPVDQELIDLLYKPSQWSVTPSASQRHRRSVYLIGKRNLRLPFLEVFDQPSAQTSCPQREATTHARQALELLNGELSNRLAGAFARRLEAECGGDRELLVRRAYLVALGRPPTGREVEIAAKFLADNPLEEFTLATFNLNEFLYVQ